MDDATWRRRMASGNPLYPYTWVAEYHPAFLGLGPSGRLKQFDVDGYHTSLDIQKARLMRLLIMNHPLSPIELPVPFDRPPDEIVMKARVDLEMDLGGKVVGRKVSRIFGYRYGEDKYLLEIDDEGMLYKTNKD